MLAAGQQLQDWLTQHAAQQNEPPLDATSLGELLVHGHDWLLEERRCLTVVDEARAGAEAVHKACLSRLAVLEQANPGVGDPADLQQQKAALGQQREALLEKMTELVVRLRQDDDRRTQQHDLSLSLAAQEQALDVWARLNELIGSADGRKFRNYAQQFTLDVLLGYANRHLEHLARRYRLERVKEKLALMVVDQDMGDEMRSVHSLSGGETFLVSLALALGLASLSSNRIKVESLFIDEGFGSLDADTLHIAMNALDCLHAQGRKVGIISHVHEMTERIGTRIQVRRLAGGQSRVVVET